MQREGNAMSGPLRKLRIQATRLTSAALTALGALALSVPFGIAAIAAIPEAAPKQVASTNSSERPQQVPQAVIDRQAAIERDLKRSPKEAWAGDYYQGDGLGMNVRMLVSPVGVATTWHGCLGLYGANEGSIRVDSSSSLRFAFNKPNEDKFGGFPGQVVPVRWGERRYLIPPDRMQDFVEAINQGFEPRPRGMGMFLLAEGDEGKPVAGLPSLPQSYLRKIRDRAVTVRVVGIKPLPDRTKGYEGTTMCDKAYRLDLHVSGNDLLEPGDSLPLQSPGRVYGSLVVESVASSHAIGMAKILESDCRKPEDVPDRTWVFTTGAYDSVAANRRIAEVGKERQ